MKHNRLLGYHTDSLLIINIEITIIRPDLNYTHHYCDILQLYLPVQLGRLGATEFGVYMLGNVLLYYLGYISHVIGYVKCFLSCVPIV